MLIVPLCFFLGLEALIAILLLVPVIPIRSFGMLIVGALKSSPANAVIKTLLGSLLVVLVFSITAINNLRHLVSKEGPVMGGGVSPGHITLLSDTIEVSLMGFSIVVAIFIERLHAFMKEGDKLKINLATLKKQAKGLETEYLRLQREHSGSEKPLDGKKKDESSPTIASISESNDTISQLESENKKLKGEFDSLKKEIQKLEANNTALKKQSQGFEAEYDRMLSENENLRDQLASFDRKYANSENKKKS